MNCNNFMITLILIACRLTSALYINNNRHRFHLLEFPENPFDVPDLKYWRQCEYSGFQYSMEWYFAETLRSNTDYTSRYAEFAEFIYVPQCVSLIYFSIREEFPDLDHHAAIDKAETEYLVPLIRWAQNTAAHGIFHGRNFFTVYAMDLGRQDFLKADALINNWAVGSLTGYPDWLEDNRYYMEFSKNLGQSDCYLKDRAVVKERRTQPQDFVISIPSRFELRPAARNFARPNLIFFAGSLNSCARRALHGHFGFIGMHTNNTCSSDGLYQGCRFRSCFNGSLNASDVLVTETVLRDAEYRHRLLTSKYCPILCGSSHTNNVRLYDAIAHGCVPVIISDDFQPPLDRVIPWKDMAVFLRTSDIPYLHDILSGIGEKRRKVMHFHLTVADLSAMRLLQWHSGLFWIAIFEEVSMRLSESLAYDPRLTALGNIKNLTIKKFENHMAAWSGVAFGETFFASSAFGCADVEVLLPALSVVERAVRSELNYPPIFIDAGANVGKTTGKIFSFFGDIPFRAVHGNRSLLSEVVCPSQIDGPNVVVVSIEPHPMNYENLENSGKVNSWNLEKWIPLNAGLADKSGRLKFQMSCNLVIDEVGKLLRPEEEHNESDCVTVVQVITLSSIIDRLFPAYQIFFVKLDIEGMEPDVIYSAGHLLSSSTIRFLMFEYAANAWSGRVTLTGIIKFLWSVGFMCFLVTEERLWPIGGPFWSDIYERVIWANYLCGHAKDPHLIRLANIHNREQDHELLAFQELVL